MIQSHSRHCSSAGGGDLPDTVGAGGATVTVGVLELPELMEPPLLAPEVTVVGVLTEPPLEPPLVPLLDAPPLLFGIVDVDELEPVPGIDIVVVVLPNGKGVVELASVVLEPAAAVLEVLVTELVEVMLPVDVEEVDEEAEEEDDELDELDEEPPAPGSTLQLSGVGESWYTV